MVSPDPRVVAAVHGVESQGIWQMELAPLISGQGWIYQPLFFGRIRTLQLLLPWERSKHIEWFRDRFNDIRKQYGEIRLSIIAHSYGTYIVTRTLEIYPQIKIDELILCGSIVRTDFDWDKLVRRNQVGRIRNDYGRRDLWAGIANLVVPGTGPSGRDGFDREHDRLSDQEFEHYGHKSVFGYDHYVEHWIPFLKGPRSTGPGDAFQAASNPPGVYQQQAFINEKTNGFVGREYVFEAIDSFLSNQRNGYFIIEGDPGVGKSAILAELVQRMGCPAHFNIRTQGINRTGQFLKNICGQLVDHYDLPYSSLPSTAFQDGALFGELLEQVAQLLPEGEKLVVAIDALDEVDQAGQNPGSNVLYLPSSLPDNVYFVMTRRSVTLPLVVHTPQHVLDLMSYREESLNDARAYARVAASRTDLRDWIAYQGLATEDFVTALAEKSESNFMYLRYVVQDLERGLYGDLGIDRLPQGLEGYYEDHWRRMGMTAIPSPRAKVKIVYVMAEVLQPVPRPLVADFAGVDQLTVQETLDEWAQFLHQDSSQEESHYSLYHSSFRDFLHRKDIVQAAGVTIDEIHALIADNLWQELVKDD